MRIDKNFVSGNIEVLSIDGNTVTLRGNDALLLLAKRV